jgi:recombination protein RecA
MMAKNGAAPSGGWHKKIAMFQKTMTERLGMADAIVKPDFQLKVINSGSSVLNLLIGGSKLPNGNLVCPGWARGRISEIYGRESSGKSTIALMGMAQALRENGGEGTGLYVDLEHAVVDTYATKLGCDFRPPSMGGTGQCMRIAPHYAEQVEAAVNKAALGGIDFIVIDSVAALFTRKEYNRDASDEEDKKGVAEVPRFMSTWIPKLQSIIAKTGTHVMFLNQTRDKIGAKGFSEEALKSTTGGNTLKFFAANRLFLKPRQQAKAKRFNPLIGDYEIVPVAMDVEVKNIKNKLDAKQGHSGMVTIRYGVGIDEIRTMINVAIAYKIAKSEKNKKKQDVFTYKATDGALIEAVGLEKFRFTLAQNPAAFNDMTAICHERIMNDMRNISDEELAELEASAVVTKQGHDDDDDYDAEDEPAEVSPEEMGEDGDDGGQAKTLTADDLDS